MTREQLLALLERPSLRIEVRGVLRADEVLARSRGEVTNGRTLDLTHTEAGWESVVPVRGGLFDPDIFGVREGLPRTPAEETRTEHWGHIELPCPIPHPWDTTPMTRLLVAPPALRPIIRVKEQLGTGALETLELNTMYTRVLNTATRIRRQLDRGEHELIIEIESRLFAERVHGVFETLLKFAERLMTAPAVHSVLTACMLDCDVAKI